MSTISIITINYNNLSGLEKTFSSVFSQSNKSFEYVVIDGGSSDGSVAFLANHKEHIDYWVSEPDQGIYHAMNKGIKAATGDFVMFVNSGDLFFDSHQIEILSQELRQEDGIVYGDVRIVNEKTGFDAIQVHPSVVTFKYFYNQTICHQACIIKKALFESVFYFNESFKIVADWEFLIVAIFVNQVNYRKIDHTISVFDSTGISSNSKYRAIAKQERLQVMDEYFGLFKPDYQELMTHSSLRSQQLVLIQKSKFLRSIVSILFFVLLLFVNKKK